MLRETVLRRLDLTGADENERLRLLLAFARACAAISAINRASGTRATGLLASLP
jgi:hypothetical protein